jgi:hypothetical protein
MPLTSPEFDKLDSVAHVIQLALTPVFLLTGIGTLINVFSTRLARVADQVDRIADTVRAADEGHRRASEMQLGYLRVRSQALDIAVILGAVGGAATCGAVLTLFVGALRDEGVAWALYALFGSAILCTIGALIAFLFEMLLASKFIRARVQKTEIEARR